MALTIQADNGQNSLSGTTDKQNANRKTIDARNLFMANMTQNQVGQRRGAKETRSRHSRQRSPMRPSNN